MRHSILMPLAAALALTACGQSENQPSGSGGGDGGDAPIANLAAADADFRVEPGQYRSTINFTKVEVAGLPKQMAAAMPRNKSFEYCITVEDSAKGLEALKQQMAESGCQYESFKASGGKIDSVFTCSSEGGFSMRTVGSGTYTPSGSDTMVVSDAKVSGGHAMHMEGQVKAQRIGDCAR